MSSSNNQTTPQIAGNQDDEVGDAALDAVSGGQGAQPIQKMDPIVVTASRLPSNSAAVQKMDPILVTATKLPPDLNGAQLASAAPVKKGT